MKKSVQVLITAITLIGSTALLGEAAQNKAEHATSKAKADAKAAVSDKDVTYGRIKGLTPGQKLAINIDNAPDKTFDLNDKGVTVHLAKGLKVGDPVKI